MAEIDIENARRIIDQTKTTNMSTDDSFIIDSSTGGTRRVEYSDMANQLKATMNIDSIAQTANGAMQKSVYDADGDGVVDNAEKVNNHTVETDVPSGAVFTDTTYNPVTPGGTAGLMSGADKTKLDGIATGANHTDVDDQLNAQSTNPVQNNTIVTALNQKQDKLTFDNAPTAGSDNPVKSGGIKTALDGKQNNLTFDNAPTQNSTNPVTSNGIYQAFVDAFNGVAQDGTGEEIYDELVKDAVLTQNLFQTIFNYFPTEERGTAIYDALVEGNSYLDLLVTELKKGE